MTTRELVRRPPPRSARATCAPRTPNASAALVAGDPDSRVRATALGALVRAAPAAVAQPAWLDAAADPDATVRRRAVETAPALGAAIPVASLVTLLDDDDTWVAEAAAFALGERRDAIAPAVAALVPIATAHEDPLVREAAVAALGALGDRAGLPAVLAGCADKPAIRRRAVLALAAFEGPEVEAALARALDRCGLAGPSSGRRPRPRRRR